MSPCIFFPTPDERLQQRVIGGESLANVLISFQFHYTILCFVIVSFSCFSLGEAKWRPPRDASWLPISCWHTSIFHG